jgi:hypothetical protein
MKLDDAQKQQVAGWIEQGLKLSDIQNKLASELGVAMTYMDVRFLIDDLKLKVKDADVPKAAVPMPAPAPTAPAQTAAQSAAPAGGVSVSVDQVTRPGALVSGQVRFSDGKSAEWFLDETGRLGLAGTEAGYRPSADDFRAFQNELRVQLERLGYA